MAAELRLPQRMPAAARAAYVTKLLSLLGLAKVQDSIVGDAKTRGLSGGEKKRLAIGCELIGSPALLFLDEPTTGLDAFQAEKVRCRDAKGQGIGHEGMCHVDQHGLLLANV